ncbi:collagen alpha-1(I) chain-like [Falco cherrug]|uniref:collagen alpha-1(I) chain-like n=1 Tax=Falco cherrug TaxID=345164 RepID=UPI002479373E|nr:collagen alpha-1(I) chain-like [Falco cherrug]
MSKEPVIGVSDIPDKHTRGFCKHPRCRLPPRGSMLHSSAPKAVPGSRELPPLLHVLTSFYSLDASRSPYGAICIPPGPPEAGGCRGLRAESCGCWGGREGQHRGMGSWCFSQLFGSDAPSSTPEHDVPSQRRWLKPHTGRCRKESGLFPSPRSGAVLPAPGTPLHPPPAPGIPPRSQEEENELCLLKIHGCPFFPAPRCGRAWWDPPAAPQFPQQVPTLTWSGWDPRGSEPGPGGLRSSRCDASVENWVWWAMGDCPSVWVEDGPGPSPGPLGHLCWGFPGRGASLRGRCRLPPSISHCWWSSGHQSPGGAALPPGVLAPRWPMGEARGSGGSSGVCWLRDPPAKGRTQTRGLLDHQEIPHGAGWAPPSVAQCPYGWLKDQGGGSAGRFDAQAWTRRAGHPGGLPTPGDPLPGIPPQPLTPNPTGKAHPPGRRR